MTRQVSMLRNGSVVTLDVPSTFNSEDDVRIWQTYYQSQNVSVWDERLVEPFVEAFNKGTIDIETFVNVANSEILARDDPAWPINESAVRTQVDVHGYSLDR